MGSRTFKFAMSLTPPTEKEVPTLNSQASDPGALEPADVEYPEGRWTAPSLWHGDAVRRAATALVYHFRERSDVLVGMELRVYYQIGNNEVWLQPDVQVVFGVERGNRGSYRVWEEGKAPDFVLDVASPSTAKHDAEHEAREFARIGVREYWRLDPLGTLMSNTLEGYSATGGSNGLVQPVAGEGPYLRSDALGLDLRSQRQVGATVVAFRDPITGEEFDGALAGVERKRRTAEDRANAEAKRANEEAKHRRTAEERVRALEKQLRNLPAIALRRNVGASSLRQQS